jgi:hypothetical protein
VAGLPENTEDALAVLDHARGLVQGFLAEPANQKPPAQPATRLPEAEADHDVMVVYADGLFDVLNLGLNAAVTFFSYERNSHGEIVKAPVLRLVGPKTAFDLSDVVRNAPLVAS